MFDIPMNTKGALDLNSIMSMNAPAGGAPSNGMNQSAPQNVQNGFSNMAQPAQNFNQPAQNFNQPAQNFNQPAQNFNQPAQNFNQSAQNFNQPAQSFNQSAQPAAAAPAPRQRPAGNGVHLKKGQKFNLSQVNPNLSEIQVCLGWDILNQACDLDASAIMLGADNKVVGDDWFVFYGQPTSPDGSITHMCDSTNGAGAGDDEIININLNKIDQRVQKIAFVVTINEALEKNLNFSMVSNAYVRVVDKSTGGEIAKFMLSEYFATVTSMVVGEVYNKGGQWRFNPVGNGFAEDLAGLCGVYGVNVAD